jgi:hypothetical protein
MDDSFAAMRRNEPIGIVILASAMSLLSSCAAPESADPRAGLTKVQQQALQFEDWVVGQLDTAQYSVAWRSASEPPKGTYATRPDVNVVKRADASEFPFALECVWQPVLASGTQVLPEAEQKMLHAYVAERGQPVFVVLGVGGAPVAPAQLYIMPIASSSDTATKLVLQPQQQAMAEGRFHYDAFDQTLTY